MTWLPIMLNRCASCAREPPVFCAAGGLEKSWSSATRSTASLATGFSVFDFTSNSGKRPVTCHPGLMRVPRSRRPLTNVAKWAVHDIERRRNEHWSASMRVIRVELPRSAKLRLGRRQRVQRRAGRRAVPGGRADVNAKRIGVWGPSYGGLLTAMALARSRDLYAAGVDTMGVHDWSAVGGSVASPSLDSEKQRDQRRLALESSPMASMTTWKSPVLLIHGDGDRNVAFNQMVALVEALRAQGVEFEELIFPDEVHDFL